MKIISDKLEAIAVTLDCDYIRSMNLTEADIDVHNLESTRNLMVYDGPSNITTAFGGAMIIDTYETEVYFLTKMTSKDMIGVDIDTLLDITKRLADKTYAILNEEPIPIDIEPYELEAMRVFTDMYIGHKMTIGIPAYNDGC